jgi:hypothetical protein
MTQGDETRTIAQPAKIVSDSELLASLGLHVVLYSPPQEAVHVETLAEYVEKERREVLLSKPTGGYRLMHVTRSREEAREVVSLWQRWRNERQSGLRGLLERQERCFRRGLS